MKATGFFGKTYALTVKDLRIEMRAKETLPPMLAFAVIVSLLLAFTLPAVPAPVSPARLPVGAVEAADVLAGFIWVTILFAGLIGFARTFEFERREAALDSMLLAPLDRSGLFMAKALANLVFIVAVEVFVFAAFFIFFSLEISNASLLFTIALLADIGFISVGTLFAALAAQTRSRELILPILALPALVPVFIAAVTLTADLIAGVPVSAVAGRGWFGILIAYDVIMTTIAALAFEAAVE
ncbi:MAG TPA: heme exporter protein CcmB [Actinomycetota bacterium]|nr:heme exporter protein CcmB [Actinomycetota bacterium]